jgi:hypothetical protein
MNASPKKLEEVLSMGAPTVEEVFNTIYEHNLWESEESVSGPGSTFIYTKNLRTQLPIILEKYNIETMFDAPCGDMNWMKYVLPQVNIQYIGADIVGDLIEHHIRNFTNKNTKFIRLNLIEDLFPKADLMLCRDCLFHLSFQHIYQVLQNFIDSDIKYLLTSTHITSTLNRDIITGDFRLINLFEKPFMFTNPPLERINDWIPPHPVRQMCLWDKSHVEEVVAKIKYV